ncbi:hypothetical protein [Cytobacillus praedii]|uniref:hypothetical protein n=1 Tax=Cytobacillus praedii TaxID=1742358 RepID=UPI002E1E7307|nr:hypothetical protein [Cytobacillus praedii]
MSQIKRTVYQKNLIIKILQKFLKENDRKKSSSYYITLSENGGLTIEKVLNTGITGKDSSLYSVAIG